MAGFNNNYYNGGYPTQPVPNVNYGYSRMPNLYPTPQPIPINLGELQYVTGIEGANAYQLPPGVNQMVLWDTDNDSFYIKKLDEMGRPRVVGWKDFHDHVEPEVKESETPTPYITRQDLNDILSKIDLSKFLTKEDFERVIGELTVGERGRIVRNNEFNA